jgi:putative ABC transport system substrate-binding protein
VLCAVGTAALSAGAASAPTAEPLRRIGILMPYAEDDPEPQAMVAAFRERLQQLGWTTGREVRIDYRWTGAEAGRIRQAAKEIVALQPDVIFGRATGAIAVLHQETTTIPIVFVLVSDPVGDGFVATMARPGGNITGFTSAEASLAGKWLELLEDTAPGFSRIALMFNPRTAPGGGAYYLRLIETAAAAVAVKVVVAGVQESAEIERIIGAFAREPGGGLVVAPDLFTTQYRAAIIAAAAKYKVPAIYPFRFEAVEGGLVSYGVDVADLHRRAAGYVDRILRGQKPADLPVQSPEKYDLVINSKTAKALGLSIPPSILSRADEVIE